MSSCSKSLLPRLITIPNFTYPASALSRHLRCECTSVSASAVPHTSLKRFPSSPFVPNITSSRNTYANRREGHPLGLLYHPQHVLLKQRGKAVKSKWRAHVFIIPPHALQVLQHESKQILPHLIHT